MTKKETFINEIKNFLNEKKIELSPDALDFWNGLQISDANKPAFTANGALVLTYMQSNKEVYSNLFKAKDIGEGLGISSRTVSGAIRKLVTDGYVEKMGENPTIYAITESGEKANPNG